MTQPIPVRPTRLALAVGAALSLTGAPALGADRAGRVLSVTGPVVATTPDGSARALSRGSRVFTGDVIETNRGRVQIRFVDGALVSLRPRTEFEVKRYETGAEEEDDGGSAVMSLLRGALRTITGAIGDDPDEEYRMETPVATVGIRGTEYALHMCVAGNCGPGVDDGLYGHVVDDRLFVRNDRGGGIFVAGRYFKVPDRDTLPRTILSPPGEVLRGTGTPEDEVDEDVEEPEPERISAGGELEDETELLADDTGEPFFTDTDESGTEASSLPVLPDAAVAASVVGNPFSDGGACLSDAECTARVDDNGNLRIVDPTANTFDASDSGVTLAESGTVPALDATWGRWQGDIGVSGATNDTITGSFPWAYSGNPTTTAQLSSAFSGSGTLNFNVVGGPSPFGTINGDAWSVSTLSVSMNFSSGTATIPGSIGSKNVNLNLTGPATIDIENDKNSAFIDPSSGDRGFSIDLVDSLGSDSGRVEAVFAGDNAEGLVLEFEATDFDTGEIVEGVKILK